MTHQEEINKHERILHALKGKVQAMKSQRWTDKNYKGKSSDLDPQITQTEAEITERRRTLKELYQTI
jgi:uncharacterized protein YgiM (DUF1202 family)